MDIIVSFIMGLFVGCIIGAAIMCIFILSGKESKAGEHMRGEQIYDSSSGRGR